MWRPKPGLKCAATSADFKAMETGFGPGPRRSDGTGPWTICALRARRPVAVSTLDELMALPARDDTAGLALESLSTAAALRLIAALPRDQAEAVMLRAVVGLDANAAGRGLG